jgi:hypothetical protein
VNELIKRLMKELKLTQPQARGGLVALLRAAKQNMAPEDFGEFVVDIPGADKLLREAPPQSTLSSLAGGLGSMLGGRKSPGRWAGLAASFTELGIPIATAKKFGPIVIDYVAHHGGEDLVDKIKDALGLD